MHISNEIFGRVMKEYDDRRRQRELLIDERRQFLYENVEGYREADLSISNNAGIFLDKMLLAKHNDSDRQSFHDLIEENKKKKLRLMTEAGYPADFLDPPYVCPDCQDTGFTGYTKCHCFRQRVLDEVFLQSPRMKQLTESFLKDFSLKYYPKETYDELMGISSYDSAAKALSDANTFIDEFKERRGNLIISGTTGAGKTFLSCCIGNALYEKGYTVVYQTANRFFEITSDFTFRRSEQKSDDSYKTLFESDLLILDDLGTELTNSFTNSAVFDCINDRILTGRSTIISTNLSAKEIFDTYTGRVFSRLTSSYTWLHLFGADIRICAKQL